MEQNRPKDLQKLLSQKWDLCESQEGIVISGMAGVFPDSDNIRQFGENLLAKKDLTSDDDRRWKIGTTIFKKFVLKS